ncbi:hypothetical protein FA95DRAFT_582333 [Auriscalpium vulgare]|uniref:Uncharacterized protein n=1 Tax=Auriscalpium vulgare TaxID=40419 RepID=A0ACB8RFG5_9AGAM|nr:hypothetical protein FA95DRAFT_582333 [Auriscalpium vulgare]
MAPYQLETLSSSLLSASLPRLSSFASSSPSPPWNTARLLIPPSTRAPHHQVTLRSHVTALGRATSSLPFSQFLRCRLRVVTTVPASVSPPSAYHTLPAPLPPPQHPCDHPCAVSVFPPALLIHCGHLGRAERRCREPHHQPEQARAAQNCKAPSAPSARGAQLAHGLFMSCQPLALTAISCLPPRHFTVAVGTDVI